MGSELLAQPRVKILLVDDRPQNLTALEAALEELGQELVTARSGAEALGHLLKDEFAVILLDVRMPDMDGLETAAYIRRRDKSHNTPIIFLSAYLDDEKLLQGYDLGAVDYLVKPVRPEVLKSKVAVFVQLARATQSLQRHAELLESKNVELELAINKRQMAEAEIRRLNQRLEERVAELGAVNQEMKELYGKVKELDEIKTRFLANVSHDLRTPLSLMLGPAERLLESGELTEEQQRSLKIVERNTRVLFKHVNDLLDISKIDAGKMAVKYANADLAEIVLVTAANFDGLAQEHGISFSVEAPPYLRAQFDPEKIQRILLNLLSNAFKHAPDGGKVRCELRGEGERAVILLADSGPGIPPELRDVVFERFRQGNPGSNGRFGSSGLGLSILKEYVVLHGGTVTVGNAPEGGALFTVEMPLTAPAGVEVPAEAPEASALAEATRQALEDVRQSLDDNGSEAYRRRLTGRDAAPAPGKTLVLVVEDNPAMAEFISETLAGDCRVEVAFDGQEGLEKALALHPDVILTDVMMPRMGGEQLIREIRSRPELDSVPILVLTARGDQELKTTLMQDGAQDYLTKPFSVAEIRVRVKNLAVMKRALDVLQTELQSRSRDVTELAEQLAFRKREAEAAHSQAEAANRAKDEFLATVSHELRTPLTAVLGWVRLVRTRKCDENIVAQALETIERNAKLQAQLIEEILDVSRIISGKLRLDVSPVDLTRVIAAAIDAIRPAAEANEIQIRTELDPQAGPVWGDADRLQQVVWNLLSNAVKFTPREGRVEVKLKRAGSEAQLVVQDTGKGISPEFLPHVFERFRQADSSMTRSHGGLGLGLAIVRHLVELHGGKAQASSPGEGQGATFEITFPIVAPGRERMSPGPERNHTEAGPGVTPGGGRSLDGVRVLVVEDEADTRDVLISVLEHWGALVTAVGSVPEAMEELNRRQPDVLLSDIQMPEEDGYSLIRKLRAREALSGGFVPAAALTAHAREEDRARTLSAGFQMHVSKPVEPAELAAVVANLAGRNLR